MYSQQELDARLLDAANCLRGPVDASQFKDYIFPLLFFKRISDTWEWEYKQAQEDFPGNDELARHPDNFRFPLPEGCLWEDLLKVEENVGAGLQTILQKIQAANPETLSGIFPTVQWANKEQLPESALLCVITSLTRLTLDPENVSHDLLGNAYEYLLKNFADESGKKAGEFFTPRSVVRLMGRILDPKQGESICDPACGSGGLLVESVNEVREAGGDPRTLRLYGQEVNPTTAAIARMNLYLHDIETFKIVREDTLRNPRLRNPEGGLMKFDVIVANPPFSLKRWGRERWVEDPFGRNLFGTPPDAYADYAFIEHMVATMREQTGRLAVVMPHGVLFRAGTEKAIRRSFVESGLIEAIIRLPKNLFYNTSIPACIVVCRSELPPEREGGILFVDGSRRFVKGRNQNEMSGDDVDAVLGAYHSGVTSTDDEVVVRRVEVSEIAHNDFNLGFDRYLPTLIDDDEVTADEALTLLSDAEASLREAQIRFSEALTEAGYGQ
jgi:type I restriction enzyme M protein